MYLRCFMSPMNWADVYILWKRCRIPGRGNNMWALKSVHQPIDTCAQERAGVKSVAKRTIPFVHGHF